MKYIILLVPPFNFSLTLEKYVMAWRVNYLLGITHDSNLQLSPMNLQTGSGKLYYRYTYELLFLCFFIIIVLNRYEVVEMHMSLHLVIKDCIFSNEK